VRPEPLEWPFVPVAAVAPLEGYAADEAEGAEGEFHKLPPEPSELDQPDETRRPRLLTVVGEDESECPLDADLPWDPLVEVERAEGESSRTEGK
jgi:hypothetical protein